MYIFLCMHVCMKYHIWACLYIYYIYIYARVYIYIYMYIYMYSSISILYNTCIYIYI